jgi:hypothetical protein
MFGNVHEYSLESGGSRESSCSREPTTDPTDADPTEDTLSRGFVDIDREFEAGSRLGSEFVCSPLHAAHGSNAIKTRQIGFMSVIRDA